jgi:hypothetical protein
MKDADPDESGQHDLLNNTQFLYAGSGLEDNN